MGTLKSGWFERRFTVALALSIVSTVASAWGNVPGSFGLGVGTLAAFAQVSDGKTVEDGAGDVLLRVEGRLEEGDSTLGYGSLYDEYVVEGQAGNTISITLESLAFDTYLLLVDGDGERLA